MALASSLPQPTPDENRPTAPASEMELSAPKPRPAPRLSTAAPKGTTSTNPVAMRAQRQYQQAKIETASPTQLIVLLYDGVLRFCTKAMEAMENHAIEEQHNNLLRAQNIVSELMGSLNRELGGEVAENLFRLYLHMLEQLVHANLYDDYTALENVRNMLLELRETWIEVDRLQGTANAARREG